MSNNFKQDFGIYLKSTTNNSSSIQILQPFKIINLVMYPNKISSLTIEIDDMVGSLDFNDDILKVFVYVLKDLEEMSRGELKKKIYAQGDEPIVINFNQ